MGLLMHKLRQEGYDIISAIMATQSLRQTKVAVVGDNARIGNTFVSGDASKGQSSLQFIVEEKKRFRDNGRRLRSEPSWMQSLVTQTRAPLQLGSAYEGNPRRKSLVPV